MSEPSKPQLDALQGRLCYQFSDRTLLNRALTHRSAGRDHNERLEFLGDAVIGLAAAAAFYDRFPEADEGVLSRLRSLVVSGYSLAAIAKELDLSSCLILGESERKRKCCKTRRTVAHVSLRPSFAFLAHAVAERRTGFFCGFRAPPRAAGFDVASTRRVLQRRARANLIRVAKPIFGHVFGD